MVDETRVRYKAIADFTSLARSIRTARRNLRELREEEARLNRESVLGSARATIANNKRAESVRNLANAYQGSSDGIRKSAVAFVESAKAADDAARAQKGAANATKETAAATDSLANTTRRAYREMLNAKDAAEGMGRGVRNAGRGFRDTRREMSTTMQMADRLVTSFRRLGNWRPHLTPPFIALIPIIAGLLGLVNPLVAGLGAAGTAALGFAASLGQIAGAALVVVPALGTLLSMVAALKVAFGGIGGAFKAFADMRKATGGGGGAGTATRAELTQQEEITRAQERYARALQDVKWAQEDLADARAEYLNRLRELRKEVDRISVSEARAAANVQLARENYANVLADPGSTKGEKMAAKAALEESQQELQDLKEENAQLRKDLQEMERTGVNGDREVIQAQRRLTDAIWAQRDAQLALLNAQNGTATAQGAQTTAINAYEEALSKLSPSARRFVEIILGMDEAWTRLKRNVQERFFSQFVDDVWRLQLLFGPLESLLGNAADALGRFARSFILLVTSPEWQRDIILFGEGNVPIIDAMGRGVLSLLDGIRNLAVAAQPALLRLAEGFERGSASLSDLIARSREDGSLAAFLDRSIDRLSQWWRIVKNIGKTIFNYSQAAGEFTQWLTDGFEEITEGWLASSEEALGPDSKFKKYLEDIKPLVSEIRGLFADFFSWFARTASDPENIGQMTEMIQHIREDLGPAISNLLQKLADAEIGPKFVDAVTKLVEIISELASSPATDIFFSVLNALLEVAKWVVSNPILGTLLGTIATGFAAIAAVSFVGKFTGITTLIGWLLRLAKGGGGLPKLLTGIMGALGVSTAVGAGGAAGAAAAAGTRRGPGGGGVGAPPAVLPGQTRAQYRAAQATGGKGFNLLGSIGRGAGKGVGIAAIASIAATVIGDLIASGAASGDAGAGQRVGGGVLGAAGAGAGIGALLGTLIPIPGVGTGVGAAVGGLVGGGIGLATASDEDRAAMFAEMGNFFRDAGNGFAIMGQTFWNWLTVEVPRAIGVVAEGFMTWLTEDIPRWLGEVWTGFMTWLTVDIPTWLAGIAEGFYTWLTVDLPFALGYAVGLFWNWLTVDMPAWLATVWNGFMTWLTVDMPAWLSSVWNGFMTWLTVDLPRWLSQVAQGFWRWLTVDVPAWIASAARAFWNWLTVEVPRFIAQAAQAFWNWLTVQVPSNIAQAANAFWKWLTVDIPANIAKAAEEFWKFIQDIPKKIGDAISSFFSNFNLGFLAGSEGGKGDVPGGIAGNTVKRIQSMLPGGMRISSGYRTPAENKAAGGSSNSLHMDRNNPAVDIVGTISQMNSFARFLGAIGGWRQLYYNNINAPGVSHWPGHDDHIHVANTGGRVPGHGNGDTVPSMLTPGEFVIRKAVVNAVGPENLARFNAGVMSYAELLQRAAAMGQPSKQKQSGGGFQFFDAGGLVPDIDFGGGGGRPGDGPNLPPGGGYGGSGGDAPIIGGDLIINNPAPEPASDSLPRTIRKVAYLGARNR